MDFFNTFAMNLPVICSLRGAVHIFLPSGKHIICPSQILLDYLDELSLNHAIVVAGRNVSPAILYLFVNQTPDNPSYIISGRILSDLISSKRLDSALSFVNNCSWSPNYGGLRPLTYEDYIFGVTHAANNGNIIFAEPDPTRHRGWFPLHFFTIASDTSLLQCLGYIGDPRWYRTEEDISKEYLKRISRIYYFTEGKYRRTYNADRPPTLYAYTLTSWYNDLLAFHAFNTLKKNENHVIDPYSPIGLRPGDFFLRMLYSCTDSLEAFSIRSIYRVTARFLRMVCELLFWALSSSQHPELLPLHLFSEPETEEAFKDYMQLIIAS